MRWISVFLCSLLLLSMTATVQAAPAPEALSSSSASISAWEMEVVSLVNEERAKVGLPALTVSSELTLSAQRYSAYMAQAGFFAHVGLDGSTLVTRNEAAGYTGWTCLAENLAAGQSSPREVVDGWLGSPVHRENIFNSSVRETGVGYAAGGSYGHYWTQEFGTRAGRSQVSPSSRDGDRSSTVPLSWTSPETGHTISGDWLSFVQAHGGVDNFGYPRTEVIADTTNGGQTVQYFQRLIVEWHPENPVGYQLQRRLLGDMLYPGCDPAVSPSDVPPGPYQYFPFSLSQPTGLGHFVADYTRSGQPIYFKEYFDSHGGVDMFGYPKEEPKLRDGLWTQRFQGAVFQYHPEYDQPGYIPGTNIPYRAYRVQLELLGDEYIQLNGLPFK